MKQANVIETKKSGDSVVYQVPGAFALLFVVLVVLRRIGAYYGTVDGFQPVLYATRKLVWVFAALTVVCLAGAIFGKKTWMRAVGRYGAVLMALALVSAFVLSKYWTAKMLFLYLLHTVVYCLYMVYLLYRGEFFAYSLATSVSAWRNCITQTTS